MSMGYEVVGIGCYLADGCWIRRVPTAETGYEAVISREQSRLPWEISRFRSNDLTTRPWKLSEDTTSLTTMEHTRARTRSKYIEFKDREEHGHIFHFL